MSSCSKTSRTHRGPMGVNLNLIIQILHQQIRSLRPIRRSTCLNGFSRSQWFRGTSKRMMFKKDLHFKNFQVLSYQRSSTRALSTGIVSPTSITFLMPLSLMMTIRIVMKRWWRKSLRSRSNRSQLHSKILRSQSSTSALFNNNNLLKKWRSPNLLRRCQDFLLILAKLQSNKKRIDRNPKSRSLS